MKLCFALMLTILASTSQAKPVKATFSSSMDFINYGPACVVNPSSRTVKSGDISIDFEIMGDGSISLASRQLATGNCSEGAAIDFPPALNLKEGELLKVSLHPRGASAISGTSNSVFYARWDQPYPGIYRFYGGCTWDYACGGSGNSDIMTTTKP